MSIEAFKAHPLTARGALCLPTPPLLEFRSQFSRLCFSGELALTCIGMPDAGKSTALQDTVLNLQRSKKGVAYSTVMLSDRTDSRALARSLLLSGGQALNLGSYSIEEALVRRVLTDCEAVGTGRAILLIDEAQMLSKANLEYIKGLCQHLANSGVAPFVALFGQPEMLDATKRFKKLGDVSLINRFFNQLHTFRGLQRSEFAGVLRGFDESRWPADGPTYVQHFCPFLSSTGATLESLSPVFEAQFAALARASKRSLDDIPPKYLCSAALQFMVAAQRLRANPSRYTDLIGEAVRSSGAVAAWRYTASLEAISA